MDSRPGARQAKSLLSLLGLSFFPPCPACPRVRAEEWAMAEAGRSRL